MSAEYCPIRRFFSTASRQRGVIICGTKRKGSREKTSCSQEESSGYMFWLQFNKDTILNENIRRNEDKN